MSQAYQNQEYSPAADETRELVNSFMRRVYNWMAVGLALSAFAGWAVISVPAIREIFMTTEMINGEAYLTGFTMPYWIVLIGNFGMVFAISAGIKKFKVGTAAALFVSYAALNGVFLGPLLLIYTSASVFKAFIITAGTFGVTSLWAATTKRDLSGWGSFLFMGLIGIIIASVVNIFLASPMMDWVISIVGVGIFVGLTAYDTQTLRAMVLQAANPVTASKMAIMGALKLYLDFINLFIMLLRLFGDRR